jgi:hypothetical protein
MLDGGVVRGRQAVRAPGHALRPSRQNSQHNPAETTAAARGSTYAREGRGAFRSPIPNYQHDSSPVRVTDRVGQRQERSIGAAPATK